MVGLGKIMLARRIEAAKMCLSNVEVKNVRIGATTYRVLHVACPDGKLYKHVTDIVFGRKAEPNPNPYVDILAIRSRMSDDMTAFGLRRPRDSQLDLSVIATTYRLSAKPGAKLPSGGGHAGASGIQLPGRCPALFDVLPAHTEGAEQKS